MGKKLTKAVANWLLYDDMETGELNEIYMSGVIDYSSKDKGVVSVKNTSGTTRYISIKSYVLGNNAGSVASGKWIRQSKENAGKFSASATIRKNKSSTSTVLETLNLTVY